MSRAPLRNFLVSTCGMLAVAVGGLPAAAVAADTPAEESAGQYVDDSAITAQVKAALLRDEQINSLDVSVETTRGVVQLSGFVGSSQEKAKAAEVARSVAGVKAVENDIRLK